MSVPNKKEQVTDIVKKKNKWLMPVIVAGVAAVVLAILIATFFSVTAPKRALKKQLDIADKYLADLDYENAILAYEKAIEMDPKDARGYFGAANVYEALADRDIEEKQYTSAIDYLEKGITVLEKGIAETDSEKLKEKKTQLEEKLKSVPEETEGGVESAGVFKGELTEFPVYNIEKDVFVEYAASNVIIVWSKDEQTGEYLYGAVDLTGKEIAPVQYQSYKVPNDNGYFVMITGHYEHSEYDDSSWFEFDRSTLYSSAGHIVYEGPYAVVASNEAYIVSKQEKSDDNFGGHKEEFKMEYYDYSGKLLASVDCFENTGRLVEPAVFVNGKSSVISNPVKYFSKDLKEDFVDYDLGFVSSDGSIEWTDGDGIDVSKVDCASYEELAKTRKENGGTVIKTPSGGGVVGGGGFFNPFYYLTRPMSNYVDGYMVEKRLYYPEAERPDSYALRDEAGNECEIDPWNMILNPDGTLQYQIREETHFGKKMLYLEGDYDAQGNIAYVDYIAYNGGYLGNYGSKMQLRTADDKRILADISVKTGEIACKVFDYLKMSMEKYWLISKDGKWGYCDHDGNEVKMFDDAAAFYHGYALIIENGTAYLINEDFEKVQTIGEADSCWQSGQVFGITKGEDDTYFMLQ